MAKAEIVRIIAPEAFDYSHDNGTTLLRYEPGQIYEIPIQSIEGLKRRKAIEILDRKEIDSQLSQAQPTGGGASDPVVLTGEGADAGDVDDGEDDKDEEKDDSKEEASKAPSKPSKPSTPAKPK